jgi:hypothetical protein
LDGSEEHFVRVPLPKSDGRHKISFIDIPALKVSNWQSKTEAERFNKPSIARPDDQLDAI